MDLSALGIQQYAFTIGILIAFIGTIACAIAGRKEIVSVCKSAKIKKWHVVSAVLVVLVFLVVELYLVQPTQLLFFDDVIYQSMAQSLLNSGQAWMCNYGTPAGCIAGQIFHEPLGTSFDIAIGFLVFGASRAAAYGVGIFLAAVSVIMTFFAAFLLLKDFKAALFSETLMALSPIVLVWAAPTNSDMHLLAYSMLAVFFMLVFSGKKTVRTFGMFVFSAVLATYMKVDAFVLLPVLAIMYLLLEREKATGVLKRTYQMFARNTDSTAVLIMLLLAFVSLAISGIYAYGQNTPNNYGYVNSPVQNTCINNGQTITATSNFGLTIFEYNICSNLYFWIDGFKTQYIMQPALFTLLAIIGGAILLVERKWAFLAMLVWFFSFFLLYTAFYGGSVTFGVDWRFMLSTIAQASIFGGIGCAIIISAFADLPSMLARGAFAKKLRNASGGIALGVGILLVGFISISIYLLFPYLGVEPWQIVQAGDARFYEGLVYNSSYMIPNGCLVFSYDPTLFILNNKSSAQLYYLYNSSFMANASSRYNCLVFDYGYWCYTPNNLCSNVNSTYALTALYTKVYQPEGRTYGFYYIKPLANQTAASVV
jgi:hypothetical protein